MRFLRSPRRGRLATGGVLAAILAASAVGALAQDLPGRAVPSEGAAHVADGTPLQYASYPPTSGPHYPRWARYAFYEAEIPEGYWVHNLEHGAVVILYRCDDGCDERVAALKAVYDGLPPSKWGMVKALATPYDRLTTPVAIVAWTRVDELDSVDAERLTAFYRAWVDQGPEDIP